MTEGTATRDPRLIAEHFVKLWDASSPGELAERTHAPNYIGHHPRPGQGSGIEGLNRLAAVCFAVFPTWKPRFRQC